MAKLKYCGKYNGDEATLPSHRMEENEVPYKEFEDIGKMGLWMNIIAVVALIPFMAIIVFRYDMGFEIFARKESFIGCIASCLVLLPHEMIHGLCFKGEAKIYQNLKQGMLFVTGTEEFSKTRFLWMSMAPNLVFGFIPYLLGILFPGKGMLAVAIFGALGIIAGVGDYYNVYNTIRQVPKDGKIYMRGFHSYWYR